MPNSTKLVHLGGGRYVVPFSITSAKLIPTTNDSYRLHIRCGTDEVSVNVQTKEEGEDIIEKLNQEL